MRPHSLLLSRGKEKRNRFLGGNGYSLLKGKVFYKSFRQKH
jgi:hypothetical protein